MAPDAALQQQPDAQQQERPHVCPHPGCGQSYVRIEHCERHAKTHDPANAFTCSQCGKTFARSDVLRRHTKIHNREATAEATEGGGKTASGKRCSQACTSCATAKARCSGGDRCTRCVDLNKTCVYESTAPTSAPRSRSKRARTEDSVSSDLQVGQLAGTSHGGEGAHITFDLPPQTHTFEPNAPLPMHSYMGGHDSHNPHESHSAFTAFNDMLQGDPSLMLPPLPSTSAQPYAPPGFAPNPSSNTMLDSVLNLAFQQPQAATTSLENDLASAFFLPTEEAFFWSQFLSSPPAPPPTLSNAPIVQPPPPPAPGAPSSPHAVAGTSPAAGGYRPRILITAAGMPSRHGSPRPEGEGEADEEQHLMDDGGTGSSAGGKSTATTSKNGGAAWPKAWEPTGHESAVRLDPSASFSLLAMPKHGGGAGGAGGAFGEGPGLPKFDELVRIALLETLRFAQLSDDEYHALYGTIARIPLPVFDLLLSLFFSHFHPLLPLLHVPSFNPKSTLGQLLLIILGIGAVYAPIPGALQLGRVLVEVARRGVEHLINRDNRLARSLPIAQTQMLWAVFRWIGSARTVELAEVFRSVHTTMLRRQRVFDESGLRSAQDDSPSAQWSAFIANEERRRTAMACFLLEGEAACLLHLPISINGSELQTLLPCSEALWNSPTAEAWMQLQESTAEPVTVIYVTKLLTSSSTLPLPATITLSPFGAHVLIQALHMNIAHVQQLRLSGMESHASLMTIQIRRSLVRLGRGLDEFTPRFNNRRTEDDPSAYAAPHAWYHFALLATFIPLEELDVTAHKESEEKAGQAREKWTRWMAENGEDSRIVALHAGQLLRIVRNNPTHGTYEPLAMFYASLVLYLYIRSVSPSQAAGATPTYSSTSSWAANQSQDGDISSTVATTVPYILDSNLHDPSVADCSSWLTHGGPVSLSLPLPSSMSSPSSTSSVFSTSPSSVTLAGPVSAVQVLRATSTCLAGQSVWRIGRVFAAVLDGMARKDMEGYEVGDVEMVGSGEGEEIE